MFCYSYLKLTLIKLFQRPIIKISKSFSRRNLYKWLITDLESLKPAISKSLCIGAGGEIETIIRNNGNLNLITIDIDKDRNPDYIMDATNLEFEDEFFDIIFLLEVLEHIKEPYKAIKECYRVLKPSGKIVISSPFVFGIHDAPYDYYRFTKFGLSYILRDFINVEIRNRNCYFESTIVLILRYWSNKSKKNKILGLILILLFAPLAYFARLLDILLKSDASTTGYYTTAQKE